VLFFKAFGDPYLKYNTREHIAVESSLVCK